MSTAQWHVVDDSDSGVSVAISDAGRKKYEDEQHDLSSDRQRAEILMWTVCASVVAIAALVIKHILGV
jgi:hypothetical protein